MKRTIILRNWHVGLLVLVLMSLFTFNSQAQLTITGNNGYSGSCIGETKTYTLNNTIPGVSYTWSISPLGQNMINVLSNNQVQIQWLTVNYNTTINVSGSNATSATYNQVIVEALSPFITTQNEVGCQIISKEHFEGGVILTEECTNVCEYSAVSYFAHSMYPSTVGNLSRFEWTVYGGLFSNGLTTLTGSTFPSNLLATAIVTWGPAGPGSITVKEYCVFDCTPVEKTYCMNIIESPHASFMMDGLSSLVPPDYCYKICQNHEVNFQDLSTASSLSPILFWEWDFGDNSPHSALQNPSHIYGTPGTYTVVLRVTNRCGCVSAFKRQICVSEKESPKIYCPSVVCENNTAIYGTTTPCNPYTWTIVGGTQQLPQNDPEVSVKWDNVGPDGFGYVSLLGANCEGNCPSSSTVKVPVILTNGTIIGDAVVCSNKYYRYTLPAWPATNFTWTLVNNTTGSVINGFPENGHEIEIRTGSTQGSFQIHCEYYNTVISCSGTATLNVDLKLQPVISAPEKNCRYSSVVCNVSNPPAGSGTTVWTVTNPAGIVTTYNIANGVSTITIPGSIFGSVGNYTIKASNPSIFCDPEPVVVKVVDTPTVPVSVNGPNPVCLNYPYTYTVDPLPGTTVHWSISNGHVSGTTNTTTATGNNVTIIWTNNGSITVYREWDDLPGCISPTITRNISKIVVNGNVVKTSDPSNNWVCEDGSATFNVVLTNGIVGEAYEWTVVPQQMGSVSSGQGTASCSVTFNHVGTTNCQVKCKVTKCGASTLLSLNVPIVSTTSITSVTYPTPVCSGNIVNFTASTSGASASSFIWDFGDGTIMNPAGSTVQHTFNNMGTTTVIYNVAVKAVSSCNGLLSAVYFVNVTVNPQPNASISPGGVTFVCPPATYSFLTTISSPGTNTYQWYFQQAGSSTQQVIIGATGVSYTITNTPPNVSPVATSSLGQYWAVVTNTFGCSTKTNVRSVLQDPNCNVTPCNPVSPAGISNFTTTLLSCGQVQANCITLGTPGVNIIGSPVWTINNYGVPYTISGPTNSFSISPIYTLTKPGVYQIQLAVTYQNSIPGNPPCTVYASGNIIVPIIADFKWGLACNGSANGYDLTLKDYSPVFGNNPITSRTWTVNGSPLTNTSANPPAIPMTGYLGQTIPVTLTVDNGSGFPCTQIQNITIPNLPVANFTTSTTNLTYPTTRSCEGREVVFTNTSTPSGTIVKNVWNFGDFTELHDLNGIRVYDITSTTQNEIVKLIVTDQFGCSNSTTDTIAIDNNNLGAKDIPNTYTINPSTPPCFGQSVNVQVNLASGSSTPNKYQWYIETVPSLLTTVNNMNAINQGAYWVQLWDANYCYKNINPPPAVVSFIYPVAAVITGSHDACVNEPFTLKGPPGTGLTYSWVRNPGNYTVGTTQTITESLPVGAYSYTLTVSQSGGCSSVSAAYVVTVHALPQPPSIGLSVVDCDSYTLKLVANPGNGFCYNWSDGQTGAGIQVNHGGPYRVWLTDQFGCKSHNDIDVPLAPNTYFWRFPTGCYSYCPEDLPKWVDGPSHVVFKKWAWFITNGGNHLVVSPNHGVPGTGANSLCERLWLDLPPLGSGSGPYNWMLYNGLCTQESGMMNVEMKDKCCKVDIKSVKIECNKNTGNYDIILDIVNNSGCTVAFYNLYVLNAAGISIASFSSQTPPSLVPGQNNIQATIPVNALLANVNATIRIEVFCNSGEHCVGSINMVFPDCKFKSEQSTTWQPGNGEPPCISELNIVPNPATTAVSISYRFTNDNAANSRSITIYDALGRHVAEIKIGDSSGTYNLDVSNYKQGIYFIETRENNNHVLVKRMLINH